jgi:hypothetical protein
VLEFVLAANRVLHVISVRWTCDLVKASSKLTKRVGGLWSGHRLPMCRGDVRWLQRGQCVNSFLAASQSVVKYEGGPWSSGF